MSGRRARLARRKARALALVAPLNPSLREKLQKARADRDAELGKLATAFREATRELHDRHAVERRKVWRRWEERRDLILEHDDRAEAKARKRRSRAAAAEA